MSVHRCMRPDPEETASLADDWHIYEAANGERRIVAVTYISGARGALCSSPVESFDASARLVTTSTGHRYRLRNHPRMILLTETMRNAWQSKQQEPLRDVSHEYWRAIREAGYLTGWEVKRLEIAREEGRSLDLAELRRELDERVARNLAVGGH